MMQGNAYILVRSVVPNPDDRKPFDHWYQTNHLPRLISIIPGLRNAWRFWSVVDPSVHYAFGEFADMNALRRAVETDGFKVVLAHYDRDWEAKGVTRTRDIIERFQHLPGASRPRPEMLVAGRRRWTTTCRRMWRHCPCAWLSPPS